MIRPKRRYAYHSPFWPCFRTLVPPQAPPFNEETKKGPKGDGYAQVKANACTSPLVGSVIRRFLPTFTGQNNTNPPIFRWSCAPRPSRRPTRPCRWNKRSSLERRQAATASDALPRSIDTSKPSSTEAERLGIRRQTEVRRRFFTGRTLVTWASSGFLFL